MQTLIIPVGIAGSGKSTYIRQNYPEFQRICMDEIRGRFSLDPADKQQTVLARDYCMPLLEEALAKGESVVWDATSLTEKIRKGLIDAAQKVGAKTVIVFFSTPLEVILKRNSSRKRIVPEEAIMRQWNELEKPKSNEADKLIVVAE